MRRTDIVISNEGIRPAGSPNERATSTTRMYIQSNYIKRELAEEFTNQEKLNEARKTLKKVPLLGCRDFVEKLKDKVDNINSPERIDRIHNHVYEMEYMDALKQIFK